MCLACTGQIISAGTSIPSIPVNFKASDTTINITPSNGFRFGQGSNNTFASISLTWNNPDNSYYLVAIQTAETNPVPINTRDTMGTKSSFRIFRTQPSTSSGIAIQATQFVYYGKQRIILYHLNADYAALYNFSGNTTLNITEPHT